MLVLLLGGIGVEVMTVILDILSAFNDQEAVNCFVATLSLCCVVAPKLPQLS